LFFFADAGLDSGQGDIFRGDFRFFNLLHGLQELAGVAGQFRVFVDPVEGT
jgi:hypothetical protein